MPGNQQKGLLPAGHGCYWMICDATALWTWGVVLPPGCGYLHLVCWRDSLSGCTSVRLCLLGPAWPPLPQLGLVLTSFPHNLQAATLQSCPPSIKHTQSSSASVQSSVESGQVYPESCKQELSLCVDLKVHPLCPADYFTKSF